ncbi:protein of unassigned function [Methylobacterium oryzae CBMB20]|uniref:Protein of unassigned function n=1 Tax=Methylobacterium oryzae CBMB20 TaxID=693986 RepID=A0A089P382_9HYPH|nr:protein of unassigned function [Methylobacterium oryzae CBMB20]
MRGLTPAQEKQGFISLPAALRGQPRAIRHPADRASESL